MRKTYISAKVRHPQNNTSVWERGHKDDIIKSAGFNARMQLDGLNMYKTDTSYKGKHIGTAFGFRKGFRKKCTFICEASNRLTKNECWLRQDLSTYDARNSANPHAESSTTRFLCFCD